MKKNLFVIFMIVFACINVNALLENDFDVNEVFALGVNEYTNKNYQGAYDRFKSIVDNDSGFDNYELNFNLGSCCFKLEKYGEARFYFERALMYNPFDKDLENNLSVLYNIITDDAEMAKQEIMLKKVLYFFNSSLLIYIISIFTIASIILFLLFVVTKGRYKAFWLISSACIIISVGAFVYFGLQTSDYNKVVYVVTAETTNVYLSPTDKDSILVTLSVGAKGQVLDILGSYIKTKMPDGSSGWIKRADIIATDEL